MTVFAAGVNTAPGVAFVDGGDGGVWVALICLVLVGVALLDPNNLCRPRCIEQDDSTNIKITATDTTETFFIFCLHVKEAILFRSY